MKCQKNFDLFELCFFFFSDFLTPNWFLFWIRNDYYLTKDSFVVIFFFWWLFCFISMIAFFDFKWLLFIWETSVFFFSFLIFSFLLQSFGSNLLNWGDVGDQDDFHAEHSTSVSKSCEQTGIAGSTRELIDLGSWFESSLSLSQMNFSQIQGTIAIGQSQKMWEWEKRTQWSKGGRWEKSYFISFMWGVAPVNRADEGGDNGLQPSRGSWAGVFQNDFKQIFPLDLVWKCFFHFSTLLACGLMNASFAFSSLSPSLGK